MQLQDAHERFEIQLEADGRSAHTRKLYAVTIAALGRWLTAEGLSHELEQIDHMVLARFMSSDFVRLRRDGRPKKAACLNTVRSGLRVFFRYCLDCGFAQANAARLQRHAICAKPPPRALSAREQEKLASVLEGRLITRKEKRDAFLVRFLLATGLRLDSALRLNVEDIDLEDGSMRVWTKRDRTRVLFLSAEIRELLRKHLGGRVEGPVFMGAAGRRLGNRQAQRRVRDLTNLAGLPMSARPHSLRHSFAVALYGRTRDIALVQRALGHESIISTLRYAGATDDQLRQAMG